MSTMAHAHHAPSPRHRWYQTVFPILRPKPEVDTVALVEQVVAARARTDVQAQFLRRAMAQTLIEVDRHTHDGLVR